MLIDEILGMSDSYEHMDIIKPLMKTAQPLLIDNVAKYLIEDCDKEYLNLDDFPILIPPWEVMWFEWEEPFKINSNIYGINDNPRKKLVKKTGALFRTMKSLGEPPFVYRYNCLAFEKRFDNRIAFLPWEVIIHINENGQAIAVNDNEDYYQINLTQKTNLSEENIKAYAIGLIDIPLMAISFCHCKNIIKTIINPPNKLNKKRTKIGKLPLIKYWILDINPMKTILRDEGQSEKTGLKKALHICRGHFATYTEDAPLFGRVTGTFWKPMHIRGNKKEGVVIKDYKIKAPEINHG